MMRNIVRKKIAGGKMLTVEWEVEGDKITFFKLSGDFFAYPEWCIEEIERSVIGTSINNLGMTMEDKMKRNSFEIIGFTPQDVQKILMEDFE